MLADDALDGRPDALLGRAATRGRQGIEGASQIVEVGPLGIIELQGARGRLEDAVGDPAGVAAFQALVVLDADAGARGQELGDVVGGVHTTDSTPVTLS